MFSVAPNILLAPNMMQNAERKHRTQNTNTAHIRSYFTVLINSLIFSLRLQIVTNLVLVESKMLFALVQQDLLSEMDFKFR